MEQTFGQKLKKHIGRNKNKYLLGLALAALTTKAGLKIALVNSND